MLNFHAFLSFFAVLTIVSGEMTVFRLPDDTRPISYTLVIAPDYDAGSANFDGEVEIVIYATTRTSMITLNCKDLVVYVAYVREKETDRAVNVIDLDYIHQNEQLFIKLEYELQVHVQYVVNVEFYGTVENGMTGFYKSTCGNPDVGVNE